MMDQRRARTFKALSALLSYPSRELQTAIEEVRAVIHDEGLLDRRALAALDRLMDEVRDRDIYDLQERYTLLFDRSRSLSLHLFEHVHGESRDRGQAMVDLADHYARHGFEADARELPDFLPLFLEFLSVIPVSDAKALLDDPIEIVAALEQRLRKRRSPYASVFAALQTIAAGSVDPARLAELTAAPDPDPSDLETLDADWEEAAVTFGPLADPGTDVDGCGAARLATRLRAATRDAALGPPR